MQKRGKNRNENKIFFKICFPFVGNKPVGPLKSICFFKNTKTRNGNQRLIFVFLELEKRMGFDTSIYFVVLKLY